MRRADRAAAAEFSASHRGNGEKACIGVDIPTTGSAADVRQLLDAKLTERGHEPMKVQVIVCTGADGVTLCLEDVEGTFLEVRTEKRGSLDEEGDARSEEDSDESLQQSLQAAHSRNQKLTEELLQVSQGGPGEGQGEAAGQETKDKSALVG